MKLLPLRNLELKSMFINITNFKQTKNKNQLLACARHCHIMKMILEIIKLQTWIFFAA